MSLPSLTFSASTLLDNEVHGFCRADSIPGSGLSGLTLVSVQEVSVKTTSTEKDFSDQSSTDSQQEPTEQHTQQATPLSSSSGQHMLTEYNLQTLEYQVILEDFDTLETQYPEFQIDSIEGVGYYFEQLRIADWREEVEVEEVEVEEVGVEVVGVEVVEVEEVEFEVVEFEEVDVEEVEFEVVEFEEVDVEEVDVQEVEFEEVDVDEVEVGR